MIMERLHWLQQLWISVAKVQNFSGPRKELPQRNLDSDIYIWTANGHWQFHLGVWIHKGEEHERVPCTAPIRSFWIITCLEDAGLLYWFFLAICLLYLFFLAICLGAKGDSICFCLDSTFILRFWLPSDHDSYSSYLVSFLCAATYTGTGRASLSFKKSGRQPPLWTDNPQHLSRCTLHWLNIKKYINIKWCCWKYVPSFMLMHSNNLASAL